MFGAKNTLITCPKIVYWLSLTANTRSLKKNNSCSITKMQTS